MSAAKLLQSLSSELAPQRLEALVYDAKSLAMEHPGHEGFSYQPILNISTAFFREDRGKVSVDLAAGTTMVLSELLDVSWQRKGGLVVSRVVTAADITGNNRPPLEVSESDDGGEMFRHFRPSEPRAQDLLQDFLADLMNVSVMADKFWGSMRSLG